MAPGVLLHPIRRAPFLARQLRLLLAGGLLAGCGGSDLVLPDDGGSTTIEVIDGDGQQGTVGELLASPIVVRVTDAAGDPILGAEVEFAVISAGDGAEIQPSTATTDKDGLAKARLLLGEKVGLQTGEARLAIQGSNPPKASFTAVATPADNDPPPPPPTQNQAPRADFDVGCQHLTCDFSDRSSDDDGSVVGRVWDFGDGATSTDRNPSHEYAAAGTFHVQLSVTDDGGAQDSKTHDAHPEAPPPPPPASNEAPHADFDVHCKKLACEFTDKSKDDDGAIVRRQWSFGDGGTSTEANPNHTYDERGRYEVSLTVTDDGGKTADKTRKVDAKK